VTWFKVDDKMWSHPKALHTSSLALGVWVRVGSYCADQLTDGVVDDRTVHAICPEPRAVICRAIDELVRVGLWQPHDDQQWAYHDWADHQPTRSLIENRRAADREKKARQRRDASGQFTVLPGGRAGNVP
jgi:hypothetical protein